MNASELALSLIDTTPPPSYKLRLALGGSVADKVVVNASQLPLTLIESVVPPSNALPLTLGSNDNGGDDGGGDNPNQGLANSAIAGCLQVVTSQAVTIKRCHSYTNNSRHIANDYLTTRQQVVIVANCYRSAVTAFVNLSACTRNVNGYLTAVNQCFKHYYIAFILLSACDKQTTTSTIGYQKCYREIQAKVKQCVRCDNLPLQPTIAFKRCLNGSVKGKARATCHTSNIQQAVPVPCRYYPIPEPPPIKPKQTCKPPPLSSELPLTLRSHGEYSSDNLPLPLTCWHDVPTLPIPNKDTYIMYNELSANIGGINIDEPMSFSIKTDMDSYCWQGSIEISPDDYEKVKHKLEVELGKEPLINVTINNHRFAIIAEEQSRSRQFVNYSHSLSGRSLSARLGADYAKANSKIFQLDSYAGQLVNEQLADLPISVEEFAVEDWRIPAGIYSVSDKTPIAVIADIADACGGFIVSHDYDAKLSIKKRWKVSAWELATATPDVIVPLNPIVSTTEKINKATRYNVVKLFGIESKLGDGIYRELEGRDIEAPSQTNSLFTSEKATVAKGCQILSDSGTHAEYVLKLPWSSDSVGEIPLAELGQIWQVNDEDEKSWKGVVTAVGVDVKVNNKVAEVWQSVTLDRYLDN